MIISKKDMVVYVSLVVVVLLIVAGAVLKLPYLDILADPIFAVTILAVAGLTPYGYYEYMEKQSILARERRLPDLLRDIAEYSNFGLPVSQALLRAGNNDYGKLTPLVQEIANKISSGIPVEEAVTSVEKNVKSKVIKRAFVVLRKATESGNNISGVLRLISEFSEESEIIREGRISEMKNFVLVMYVSFAVFFFVVLVIDLEFLAKIAHSGFTPVGISSVSLIKKIFSAGIIIQGGSTGFMSGILKDGSIGTGAFFTGITLLVSVIILAIFGVI